MEKIDAEKSRHVREYSNKKLLFRIQIGTHSYTELDTIQLNPPTDKEKTGSTYTVLICTRPLSGGRPPHNKLYFTISRIQVEGLNNLVLVFEAQYSVNP
jgi:hypothetical protein